jgi:Alpha/beta hydrolase
VSELTLQQLLSCDPAPYAQAAVAWQEWAKEIDNTAELFIRAARDLGDAWPEGEGAEATHRRAAALRDELSNAYQPAQRIGYALQRLADGMAQLRDWAGDLVARAGGHGLEVDVAAGTVTAPLDMYRSGSPAHTTALVNGYHNDLTTLLARARGLDDAITREIVANVPDPVLGFGTAIPQAIGRPQVERLLGRSPAVVRLWWQGLTPTQQDQAIHDFPNLVGWLDGVPATDRNTANRLRLQRDAADLQQRAEEIRRQITDLDWSGDPPLDVMSREQQLLEDQAEVNAERRRLGKVEATLAGLGDKGFLLGYDPAGDGKAVVAVGNPDTAAHTAVWVPGLNTELDDIKGNTSRVEHIQEAADLLTPETNDVAAVMWLGYDAPETDLSVLTHGRSEQGGKALDSFVDGLNVTHDGGQQHVTAIGHSYGSTVVAEAALRGNGLAVDEIVVAGSPGMHTDHAADLNIDPRHVWSGSAPGDPVSDPYGHHGKYVGYVPIAGGWLNSAEDGIHGISPHQPEFGANRFHVDATGHSDYWKEGSESLTNQAYVVVGAYDEVHLDHGEAPSK